MAKIVAELGINHNGSPETALHMIYAASESGCDAVKVQSYRTDDFLERSHSDYEMFHKCEIWQHLGELLDYTRALGIMQFGATPTSVQGVKELDELGVDFIKIGSDYTLRLDVIEAAYETGRHVVVSTGMCDWREVQKIARIFRKSNHLTVLACTSAYPCPADEANLWRINYFLRDHKYVGYSDHTLGVTAAVGAAFLGASMIEKHFTLSKDMDGPDHWFSADPAEMRELVAQVRVAEQMCGSGLVDPQPSELPNREKWRIKEGEKRG